MATFIKLVSGVYLIFVWGGFAMAVSTPTASYGGPLAFFVAIGLSIPAAVLFAFAQIVEDVRIMRDHLKAMRAYYEPQA